MCQIYRGFSIGAGPNDGGCIIRDPDGKIVGHQPSYAAAYYWIDECIAAPIPSQGKVA